MSAQRDIDQCEDHEGWLPAEAPRTEDTGEFPCSNSGPKGRIMDASCHIEPSVSVRADATLIISWQEVDRLLDKKEYAAALLVAAVNLEFILWESLRRLSPASPPCEKSHRSAWRTWQKVNKPDRDSVGLGSLIELTRFFEDSSQLALSPPLNPFGCDLNGARRRIAHERGYFARLTQLKEPDWSEACIRQVLEDTQGFCHGNAP